jgi:hypothetical protein
MKIKFALKYHAWRDGSGYQPHNMRGRLVQVEVPDASIASLKKAAANLSEYDLAPTGDSLGMPYVTVSFYKTVLLEKRVRHSNDFIYGFA